MPKTNSAKKPVRSFRLSQDGVNQLRSLASAMGRSESDVLEVALDRMYREEIRYNQVIRERVLSGDQYQAEKGENENGETTRGVG